MKSRLTLSLIGCTLLTFLTPSLIHARPKDVGTNRQPRTCSSTSEPKTGPISAAQAMIYVACRAEGDQTVKTPGIVDFIDILSLEVDPKPRQVTLRDVQDYGEAIDREKPTYTLTGSVVSYACSGVGPGHSAQRGQNCTVRRIPQSLGKCYKTPFKDWRCSMGVYSQTSESKMPPPD